MTWSVYVITCLPTGLRYVGITKYPPLRRLGQHFAAAFLTSDNRGCPLLGAAIRQNPSNRDWQIDEITAVSTRKQALAEEKRLIGELRTIAPLGYNTDHSKIKSENIRKVVARMTPAQLSARARTRAARMTSAQLSTIAAKMVEGRRTVSDPRQGSFL